MTNHQCHECQRLWGEYISALLEHARLDRKVYFISVGQESGPLDSLKMELETTRIARDGLRERIRQHEQTHQKADAQSV